MFRISSETVSISGAIFSKRLRCVSLEKWGQMIKTGSALDHEDRIIMVTIIIIIMLAPKLSVRRIHL